MTMDVLFAGVPVREFTVSLEWYTRLFGRPADVVAHEHEVMWRVTDTGWLYIVEDPARAGGSLVAISVRDLEAAVAEIDGSGLQCGPILPEGDAGRKSTINDPDGNTIALIEVRAVPGVYDGPDGRPGPVLLTLIVDGETFAVRRSADGGTAYEWLSGPNEGYGFGTSGTPSRTEDEHRESIRSFLAMIDPATGYIGDS